MPQLDPSKLGTNSGGAMSFANRVFEPYPWAIEADSTTHSPPADHPLPDTDCPRVAFRKGKEAVVVTIGSPPRDVLIKRRPLWKDFRYLALCSVFIVMCVGLLLLGIHYYGLWERMQKQQKQNTEEQMALQAQLLETKDRHMDWQRNEFAAWKEYIQVHRLLLEASTRDNVTLSEQLNETKIALDDCNERTRNMHGLFLRMVEQRERTNEENLALRQQLGHYELAMGQHVNSLNEAHETEKEEWRAQMQEHAKVFDTYVQHIRQLQTQVDEQAELIGLANSTRQEMSKLIEEKDHRIKRLEASMRQMMQMAEKISNEFNVKVQEHVQEHLQEHYSTQAEREQHINALFRRMEADLQKAQALRVQCCSPGGREAACTHQPH